MEDGVRYTLLWPAVSTNDQRNLALETKIFVTSVIFYIILFFICLTDCMLIWGEIDIKDSRATARIATRNITNVYLSKVSRETFQLLITRLISVTLETIKSFIPHKCNISFFFVHQLFGIV